VVCPLFCVLLFCCSAVLLFCCSAVLLFCCSAVLLFCYFVGEPERPPYKGEVSETAKRLASNVRLLRTVRGWSQETLALNAGLDRSFVGAVERAERNITLATAEKLAQAFGLTVADLLVAKTSEVFVRALRPDNDN